MPSAEVRSFQVTIPAGTAIDSFITTDIPFPPRIVDTVEWVVPPGPSGLMGFRITMAGVNVIPVEVGTWIVADNDTQKWDMDSLPDSGAWQLQGYNTDVFDHTVYLRFLVSLVGTEVEGPVFIPNSQLST